ncbi:MAG: hypothetical protein AAGG07_03925 [Planctomycetota bacterium]
MNDQDFNQKLGDILTGIEDLPAEEQDRIRHLAEETRSRHDRMRKTISELQESLDYLRLSVKYLVFDLEATRRENQYLRKLIDTEPEQE